MRLREGTAAPPRPTPRLLSAVRPLAPGRGSNRPQRTRAVHELGNRYPFGASGRSRNLSERWPRLYGSVDPDAQNARRPRAHLPLGRTHRARRRTGPTSAGLALGQPLPNDSTPPRRCRLVSTPFLASTAWIDYVNAPLRTWRRLGPRPTQTRPPPSSLETAASAWSGAQTRMRPTPMLNALNISAVRHRTGTLKPA